MHARVATFENRDTPRLDGLVRRLNARESAEREVPGALGMYLLVDRTEGRALGLSLFESMEAMKEAEPFFDRIGTEIVEEMRGRRLSIEFFDMVLHDVLEGATAARMTTFRGDLGGMPGGLHQAVEEMYAEIRTHEGWRGTIGLADRTSEIGVSLTLWESAEALRASDTHAASLRRRAVGQVGEMVLSVSRFEVPFTFDRAPRLELSQRAV